MYRKKKSNLVVRILIVLFLLFMVFYIANLSGYYESKIRNQVYVTNEGIKMFEDKIEKGEKVDITSFLDTKREDYSSVLSKLGDNVTGGIESVVSGGMRFFSNVLKSLF